jgi:NlpB/DapX lipoprotein
MKSPLIAFTCAAALLLAAGCITDNGKFPTPTANFTPKKEYSVSHDKLWQATLDALDDNRIAVVSTDKADGVIQTDYIAGPGEVNIALAISQVTRYKFEITLRDKADSVVRLNIICTIEDSMSSSHNTSQWRDVTSQNAALENKLETWLYEQVEDEMKK